MFPVMVFPWPLTLGSYEVKGGCGSHVLRKYDRQGVSMVISAFPSGPSLFSVYLCCPRFLEQAQGSVPQGPVAAVPGTGTGLWRVGG